VGDKLLAVLTAVTCLLPTLDSGGVNAEWKNYQELLDSPQFLAFHTTHYPNIVFSAHFQEWLRASKWNTEADTLINGDPSKPRMALRPDNHRAYLFYDGRSFGGFHSDQALLEYNRRTQTRNDDSPHAVVFIHGWTVAAGAVLHLVYLYHRWGDVRPEAMFGATYYHGEGSYGAEDLKIVRSLVESVYDYMGGRSVDVVAASVGVPVARRALIGGVFNGEELGPSLLPKVRRFIGAVGPNQGLRICFLSKRGWQREVVHHTDKRAQLCHKKNGFAYGSKFLFELNAEWKRAHNAHPTPTYTFRVVPDHLIGNLLSGKRSKHSPKLPQSRERPEATQSTTTTSKNGYRSEEEQDRERA
jgi:Lipase (class 2)